jgi:hypothetical protein
MSPTESSSNSKPASHFGRTVRPSIVYCLGSDYRPTYTLAQALHSQFDWSSLIMRASLPIARQQFDDTVSAWI